MQFPSLVFMHMDNLILFFSLFKLAKDVLPRQFTREGPAASVQSTANYIDAPFIPWDLTVRCGGGALCHQDL